MLRFVGNFLSPEKYLRRISRGSIVNFEQYRNNSTGLPKSKFKDDDNIETAEALYRRWLESPSSVSQAWDSFFRTISQNSSVNVSHTQQNGASQGQGSCRHYVRGAGGGSSADSKVINDNLAVLEMIRSFQLRGYHLATLDPLGLTGSTERLPYVRPHDVDYRHDNEDHKRLVEQVKAEIDMDRVFTIPPHTFIGGNETALPLREIIKRLEEAYCRNVAVEIAHMNGAVERLWLKKKFESPGATKLSVDLRRLTLARLLRAAGFEAFSAKKFPSTKRFGGEGGEVVVPCMKQMMDKSMEMGCECVIMAMAHRARLNVMANVCRIPLERLYTQFLDIEVTEPDEGDIRYHLGLNYDRMNKVLNKTIKCILISNPSHLECSTAVMEGRAYGEQYIRQDKTGRKVLPIVIHGDAAVVAQGISAELQNLSDLPNYTTNGTIHIVLNNQVGFTTNPIDGRSYPFCSDLGKLVGVPIIHVNGNDPDAVIFAANVCAEWRALFHRNIFLDLITYRLHGHSEDEEPAFTQPRMYQAVAAVKPAATLYTEKLISEGVVTEKEVNAVNEKYIKISEEAIEKAKKNAVFIPSYWIDNPWPEFPNANAQQIPPTGIPEDILMHIAKVHSSPPAKDMVLFKAFDRIFKARAKMVSAKLLDWSLGEAVAFGSLLKEGIPIRLAGQDVQRGTFAHRHYVLHNQSGDYGTYTPMNHLYPGQASINIVNAPLSEFGVLGFEYGFSHCSPKLLVIWEAQFGDFSNVCQCILDCFICCAEAKWRKQSGLVINLPHGLEGKGADHSSARAERFLLMCLDDPTKIPTGADAPFRQLKECNWIVTFPTTPANYFHAVRRQMHMPFRKVLVNFAPKSMLRLPAARSPIADFLEGTSFRRVIPDPVSPAGVKKACLCCGKVYYDLLRTRAEKKLDNEIALIRIEQVFPFPYDLVKAEVDKYPNAKLCFVQEEHMNQGFQHFVIPRLHNLLPGKEIKLISRVPACAGSTGFPKTHRKQLAKLLEDFINA